MDGKQLVSIKRAKHGTFWSNRMPGGDKFKNVGGINKTVLPITRFLRWIPRRIVQNLPKKPEGGYKAFGERMFHPCNMRDVLHGLRSDPVAAQQDHAFWIGHASQLLCLRSGTNLILDPIYSKRASPFQSIGPKRVYQPAASLDELPRIDIMLISHNHYDHMDKTGIKGVYARNPDVHIVVPLRMSRHLLEWGIPASSITEMDWQDEVMVKGIVVCCTPAQHWGKHALCDNNEVLWCGWVIGWSPEGKAVPLLTSNTAAGASVPSPCAHDYPQAGQFSPRKGSDGGDDSHDYGTTTKPPPVSLPSAQERQNSLNDSGDWSRYLTEDNLLPVDWPSLKTYYFTGDTAFNEVVFEMIRARVHHVDMAALPIGAYAPRWFMHGQHIDPESAVRVFKIVNCRRAYGVHYGTFKLSDEPFDEPPRVLKEALSTEEVPLERFVTIPMGGHVSF